MIFLFNWVTFRFHVNFPGCKEAGFWFLDRHVFYQKTMDHKGRILKRLS